VTVPAWLLDIFAGVMLLVAAVSAARLAAGHRDPDADIDVAHLLMGVAMAGTLTASLAVLPPVAWEVIFGLLTAWFGYRVAREYRAGQGLRALVREHHAPHLLHSAAMLYMFLALRPPAPTMAGMGAAGLRLPTLALLFAFLLVAYAVADLDRIPAPRARPAPAALLGLPAPAPALATVGAPAPAPAPAVTTIPEAPSAPIAAPASETAAHRVLGPGVARGCRIAMGVTMAFMLIIMI
jgi:Domain of unknown function (DUF5134)